MKIEVWGQTDVGLKRTNNEDNFLVDQNLGLFVVADGMGGHQGGEVASSIAVATLQKNIAEKLKENSDVREVLFQAYRDSSAQIFKKSQDDEKLKGMATTMVSCVLSQGIFYIANVGDSRAYLISPSGFWQITEDHSLFNEQMRAGLVQEKDREKFEWKNVITRSVGFESEVNCDVIERKMRPNESILICSDGLSGMVTDQSMASICMTTPPEQVVPRLIEEAKRHGGDDNITAVFVRFVPDSVDPVTPSL